MSFSFSITDPDAAKKFETLKPNRLILFKTFGNDSGEINLIPTATAGSLKCKFGDDESDDETERRPGLFGDDESDDETEKGPGLFGFSTPTKGGKKKQNLSNVYKKNTMKRPVRAEDGTYTVKGKKYKELFGKCMKNLLLNAFLLLSLPAVNKVGCKRAGF